MSKTNYSRSSNWGGGRSNVVRSTIGNSVVQHIADHMVEPKKEKEVVEPRPKGGKVKHTDEQVLAAIRRYRSGERVSLIAKELNTVDSVIRGWATGISRSYLLDQVLKEKVNKPA